MSNPLHIAIDARWIFRELSGIGLYTQELIAALTRIPSPHHFTVLFNHDDIMARVAAETGFTMRTSFTAHLVKGGPFSPLDQLRLPLALNRWRVDVFHAPNYMMPLLPCPGTRRVVTIHDLIPLLFRDYAPRSKKNRFFPVFKAIMNRSVRAADRVIAVSESTRRDLQSYFHLDAASAARIRVIAEGVRTRCTPAPRTPRPHVQFLYVGRRDPYKNLPLLVASFAALRQRGLAVALRVVGSDDPRYPEARQLARELGVDEAIAWSGYVNDAELLAAYQQADVFVLPSNYEGFGLPVLEAMACGTPVICSNTSSLPEVAGDAALMIDPRQPHTLTDAMNRLATEPALRRQLAEKGLARAALFSWDATARQTLALYEELAR